MVLVVIVGDMEDNDFTANMVNENIEQKQTCLDLNMSLEGRIVNFVEVVLI